MLRLVAAACVVAAGLTALAWLSGQPPAIDSPRARSNAIDPPRPITLPPATAATGIPTIAFDRLPAEFALPVVHFPDDTPARTNAEASRDAAAAAAVGMDGGATQAETKAAEPAKLPRGPHLQAGVFAHPANAEELKAQLEAEGLPAYIESRVQIGPFKTRREAEKLREKLKAEGMATVLIAR